MTKDELIALCKAENPIMIQTINGEEKELTPAEYENACEKWAEMRLEQIAVQEAKAAAEAKRAEALAKLGLNEDDLKALGL